MTSKIESDVRLQPNIMLSQGDDRKLEEKTAEVYRRWGKSEIPSDDITRKIPPLMERLEKIMSGDEEGSSKKSIEVRYSPGPILLDGSRMDRGYITSLKSECVDQEESDIQDPLCIQGYEALSNSDSRIPKNEKTIIFSNGGYKPPLIRDENRVKIKRRGSNSCCSVS
ncbi:MAG: hypothetical protein JSS09_02345 [Verrucomicrobia bacterium]|nr:hypothetical protein [Verrucomicrobiota bacterium]